MCVASLPFNGKMCPHHNYQQARLAQSAEHKALNLVVVISSPTVGVFAEDLNKTLSLPLSARTGVQDSREFDTSCQWEINPSRCSV